MLNQIFCHGKNDFQNQVPLGILRLEAKWGVHNKTLSINGHSDQNISQLVKKP